MKPSRPPPSSKELYCMFTFLNNYLFIAKKKENSGLPWWSSGYESACQCQGRRFDPWSGKIPHAAEQLSPCATTIEPACCHH